MTDARLLPGDRAALRSSTCCLEEGTDLVTLTDPDSLLNWKPRFIGMLSESWNSGGDTSHLLFSKALAQMIYTRKPHLSRGVTLTCAWRVLGVYGDGD